MQERRHWPSHVPLIFLILLYLYELLSVKTATFVNYLAKKNVTNALSIQEDLDRHLEQ